MAFSSEEQIGKTCTGDQCPKDSEAIDSDLEVTKASKLTIAKVAVTQTQSLVVLIYVYVTEPYKGSFEVVNFQYWCQTRIDPKLLKRICVWVASNICIVRWNIRSLLTNVKTTEMCNKLCTGHIIVCFVLCLYRTCDWVAPAPPVSRSLRRHKTSPS